LIEKLAGEYQSGVDENKQALQEKFRVEIITKAPLKDYIIEDN